MTEGSIDNVSAPRVTMVVPTLNNLYYTRRLVDSISHFVQIPYKLVFVDNGSKDGTAEYLKKLGAANPDRIHVILNHTNKGFARATNQGMEHVEGHMMWLNNDALFVRPGTVESLVDLLENTPQLGAIGPVSDAVMGPQMVGLNAKFPEFHRARFLIGFCMLVKEEVWRSVGALDESFNNAGQDDLDYSIRIQQAGYSLGVARTVFVHHVGGASQRREDYSRREAEGRHLLIAKHGEEVVEQLFLPVDFSGLRVMIAVPSWGDVQPEAYANHINMFTEEVKAAEGADGTGVQFEFAPMIRSAIVPARNEVCRMAIRRQCTHVMFIDDDMVIPPMGIHTLLTRDADVISGLCHLRTPPHFPSMFMESPSDDTGKIFYLRNWPDAQIIEVDAVGAACLLVKVDVLKKIQEIGVEGVKDPGQDLWFSFGRGRPGENTVGEDVYFCKLAKAAGAKILVDTGLQFGHLGIPTNYNTDYFKRMRDGSNGQPFPGLDYQGYEATRLHAAGSDGGLTPEMLANRMGGGGERGELIERLLTGPMGDGRNPGSKSAAGNRGAAEPRRVDPVVGG